MKIDPRIESAAQALLDKHRMSTLPIAVEELAKKENANVFPFDLGDDVSGILHITNGIANIGYNPTESRVRQRFTIAHELGHLTLHQEKGQVFVDNEKYYQFIIFRKTELSDDDMEIEQEANRFAAALLMPMTLILEELKGYSGFDLSDNSMIYELAKKFEVSTQAMSYRIINLNDSDKI
jgi:Zn-dependent peptidase ImmA (M78 family)